MSRQIIGSKGGGGGSTFVTKPDTLRSDDSFEILLGLGSGRWKGFVNGLESVKINGVSLENADGTSNFEDIHLIFADGNPLETQIVKFELGGGGNSQSVNTQLANATGGTPGGWVSGAVSTPGPNFIDLRFIVNQLFYQDDKSVRENTATVEIEMRPSGTTDWIDIFNATASNNIVYDPDGYDYFEDDGGFNATIYLSQSMFNPNGVGFSAGVAGSGLTITGKTSSPFVKEYRVAVPNKGIYANKTWEVRARLVEADTVDADPVSERRNITFETITAISTEPLGDDPEWQGLVWAKLHGKASDQFNGFPEITSICDTKLCQVPVSGIFDPEARTYTSGTWDGSFVEAFTTDPAWQIKEFVEDPIHGIAGIYPGATLDKWDALEASKYFSEAVSDGNGGTHPRFSMNLTITEAKDIDEMMQYLAGAVNSYTEDVGGGVWRFKVDKPETPVMLFTEDNVFTEFQYSHSDIDTRFNDYRGTFLDETLDYEVNTVRVFDQDDIDLNGTKFTEVALLGCTHPQEALRRLMFRLRVSLNEFRSVTFETNRVGRLIQPLDTILVADGALNPNHLVKSTSRLDSHSGTTVTLKRALRLETGVSYKVKFSTTDNEVIERDVTNTSGQRGDVTEIFIDSSLPSTVMADSAVALDTSNLAALPVAYRVLTIERSENDEDNYSITAVQIDSGKWDAMDNVNQDDIIGQESVISIDAPNVPLEGMFKIVEYTGVASYKKVLQVNWDRPAGGFFEGYRVEYSLNNGPWHLANNNQSDSIFELQSPEEGDYKFRITALDRRGVQSNPLIGSYTVESLSSQVSPIHVRGTLMDRPEEVPFDNFRYTVTDVDPQVTYVGENGVWVAESNLLTDRLQLGLPTETEGDPFPDFSESHRGDYHTTGEGLRYIRRSDDESQVVLDGVPITVGTDTLVSGWRRIDAKVALTGQRGLQVVDGQGDNVQELDLLNKFRKILTVPQKVTFSRNLDGTLKTPLPLVIPVSASVGSIDASKTSNFSITIPAGVVGSINNTLALPDRGDITITEINTSSTLVVSVVFEDGEKLSKEIELVVEEAGEPSISTTSLVDTSWDLLSSTSYIQITNLGNTIESDGSGDLKVNFYSTFNSAEGVNVELVARYRPTGGGAWSDMGLEYTGSAPTYEPEFNIYLPGYITTSGFFTFNTGSANTAYEVELFAKTTSAGDVVFYNTNTKFEVKNT